MQLRGMLMQKSISKPISIYALGGLGEVGKNMYCFENESQIVIIDCGVKFPGVELPGIDYIVPDFSHLKNNRSKIRALIITHGHEDHKGLVHRHYKIVMKAYDALQDKDITITAKGYDAIVLQHEYDHLEGMFYYDRIDKKEPEKPQFNEEII